MYVLHRPAFCLGLRGSFTAIDANGQELFALGNSDILVDSKTIGDLELDTPTKSLHIEALLLLLANVKLSGTTFEAPFGGKVHCQFLVGCPRLGSRSVEAGLGDRIFEPNRADADVSVGPQAQAIVSNGRIPLLELVKRNAMVSGDRSAIITLLDEVKAVTVINHAGLDREWRCYGVISGH